jgi:hypothetical protein
MLGSDPLRRILALSRADGLRLLETDCETGISAIHERPDELPVAVA